jgi:serine/threonine protein kinase
VTNFSGHYFGHYYLQRRIGSGGYADVYKALDIFLNRYVAVKVLKVRVDPSDRPEVLRNAHEARIAAHLKHPHIVHVIEFNIHQNIPYIVMEYAQNGSLRRFHRAGEPLPWDTIIHYARQVTEALAFIHARGFIHQDVKPENILLSDDNEILVSDFGTVAFIQTTGPLNTHRCVGTVKYMAPERFSGDPPTPASDIYSLAVVIFEWMTGGPLFFGPALEVIRQHRSVMPSPRQMSTLGIPPAVQHVLLKALAKNPAERYHSATEFYTALERAGVVADQQAMRDERVVRWETSCAILLISISISVLLSIGFYLAGVNFAVDALIFQVCMLLLSILGGLLYRSWGATRLALLIPIVAALISLLLHPWLNFWVSLPISILLCSSIGFLRRYCC